MTSLYTFLSAGTDNPDSCVPQMQPIRKEYGEGYNFLFAPFSSMLACSARTFRALVLLLVYQQVIYFLLRVSFLLAQESGLAVALFSKPRG